METTYYSCKWKIRYIDFIKIFSELVNVATHLKCKIVEHANSIEDDAGFSYMWLGLSAPSKKVFHIFDNLSHSMGISPWELSNEALFLTGHDFDIRTIEPAMVFSYFEWLALNAMNNERLIDKLSLCNEQTLFMSFEWIVRQHLIPDAIVKAYDFAILQNSIFYYLGIFQISDLSCYTLKFGLTLQISSQEELFKGYFEEIGMEFVNWQYILCNKFFDRSIKISVLGDGWNRQLVPFILLDSLVGNNRNCTS